MDHRARDILRNSIAILSLVLCAGCTAPWLPDYDVATFDQYRIEVLDGNNIWGPANPVTFVASDEGEEIAPPLAGDPKIESKSPTGQLRTPSSNTNSSSRASFSVVQITFSTPAGYLDGFPFTQTGLTDDLNGNQVFPLVVLDDLSFNAIFNIPNSRSYVQARGTQVERVIRFSSPRERESEQNNNSNSHSYVDVSYGARYLLFDDSFVFDLPSNILGNLNSNTYTNNRSFGPQVGLRFATEKNGWQLLAGGSLMFGFVSQEAEQLSSIGSNLIIGSFNQPAASQPTQSEQQESGSSYSTIGEILAQASYQLNKNLALQIGYSAMHFGDIRSAEESVQYVLPDLELNEVGAIHTVNIDGLFARLEYRH